MIPKFRVWDKVDKVIREVTAIDWSLDLVEFMNGAIERSFDNVILQQSTGLKDKNGVEIFEGDVVNYEDGEFSYIGSVKKDCYQFYINGIEPVDSYDFIDVSNTFDGTTSLTIIGNI
ncbi:YopX family protein, partial [Enterococcus malodoratus]|uniref:YopX family protein n=1 Tax=Enterococcus malodoratus TaxID=71451 RepID=UPI0039AFC3D9